jgi:nitrogen fixation NifU-like protein
MSEENIKHLGKMDDPTALAYTKGICGEEMEFYLDISENTILDIKFYTEGCEHTHLCAETTAKFAQGKKIEEALRISPEKIKEKIKNLPEEHLHCTILSTITFLKAVAYYLYKKNR